MACSDLDARLLLGLEGGCVVVLLPVREMSARCQGGVSEMSVRTGEV